MQPPVAAVTTPQMMKKPQMGTQAAQAAAHQHEQAVTPISGECQISKLI